MLRTARVVTWNGKDVPAELRELSAGRYVVEPVDDDTPVLPCDEEAGIVRRQARPRGHRRRHGALNVTHSEEAVADIVQAITYLIERNQTAAATLYAEIARCIADR